MEYVVKVNPITEDTSYYVEFLATRGMIFSKGERPHVLHDHTINPYEGGKEYDPDLIIVHNPKADIKKIKDRPYVIDLCLKDEDIFTSKEITTNNYNLAKMYYRRLGLQRTISVQDHIEEAKIKENTIPNKIKNLKQKILDFMLWA